MPFWWRKSDLSNKEKVAYFDAQAYVNQQLELRTNAALKEKNVQFAQDHAHTSKRELLDYVIACAKDLGHSPHNDEVIGGSFIAERFGNWLKVLEKAGLPYCGRAPAPNKRKIYREELKNQAKLRRQEKEKLKAQRSGFQKPPVQEQQPQEDRKTTAEEEKKLRKARDMAWGAEHENDTDEQLIDYLKQCAKELGYTPRKKDVVGSEYICKRIGSWALVCTLAEIPLPPELKPPKKKEILQYLNSRKNLTQSDPE